MNKINEIEIDRVIENICKTLPPKDGYTYFFPSCNEGKRLMITGWIDPCNATRIAKKILTGESSINDYDCVEEINL